MNWLSLIKEKIHNDREALASTVQNWKGFNDRVVFTNGCFDILHLGHMDYLAKAAELGDRLIIGVNTDRSVQKLKGTNRPIIDEYTRLMKLASLVYVDAVILFEEDTPINLISSLKPDVLVKGGDYTPDKIVGAEIVESSGGEVVVIPFLDGHSTSSIIDRIKS